MTTIVLISLGILLAGAAALMSLYYGGDALNTGQVKARATTLENAAENIQAAMTGRRFHGVRTMPTTLDDLVTVPGQTRWMASIPDISQAEAGQQRIVIDDGVSMYAVPNVSEAVCLRINSDYLGDGTSIPDSRGSHARGCYRSAAGVLTFYSVIR